MNTQVWRQLHVQILRKVREENSKLLRLTYSGISHIMKLLSKVLLLWAKQWLQRHSRLLSLQIQTVKLQKALDARPLLCLVHPLNSVSVSVSSVKYHNKAVVQRTELYTKKANWKSSKAIYSRTSGLCKNLIFFFFKKLHKCKYIWKAGKHLFKKKTGVIWSKELYVLLLKFLFIQSSFRKDLNLLVGEFVSNNSLISVCS